MYFFYKLLFGMMVGFLILGNELVDGDRSLCQDCIEFPGGKTTKVVAFGVFTGKFGYAYVEGNKRVYIPPDAYAIALNAVIHHRQFYIDTNTGDYVIYP